MICQEWLAAQWRQLEEAGILPKGKDDEHQMFSAGLPLEHRSAVPSGRRTPVDAEMPEVRNLPDLDAMSAAAIVGFIAGGLAGIVFGDPWAGALIGALGGFFVEPPRNWP